MLIFVFLFLFFSLQVLKVLSECIEKEGYSYVVEDDFQGTKGTDHAHIGPGQR